MTFVGWPPRGCVVYLLAVAVLAGITLALAALGPAEAHRVRAALRPASTATRAGANRAALAVTAAVTVSAVLLGGLGTLVQLFGAGLSYSDAQDGTPHRVIVQILVQAWLPVAVVVAAVVLAALLRRFTWVLSLGYLAPLIQLAAALALAPLLGPLLGLVGTGSSQAPMPEPSYVGGCNGTPNPANGLPDCPTPLASPSGSGPGPSLTGPPSPTG